jgi:hypothetical protein
MSRMLSKPSSLEPPALPPWHCPLRTYPACAHSFERNMLDTFFFKAPDIGQPTSVKVGQ